MNKYFAGAIALLFAAPIAPAQAQSTSLDLQLANLKLAVCQQNWDKAIAGTGYVMAADQPAHAQQWLDYRRQLQVYQGTHTVFESIPGCEGVVVEAAPPSNVPADRWERAIEQVQHGAGLSGTVTGRVQLPSEVYSSGSLSGSSGSGSSGGGSGLCQVPSDTAIDGSRCGRRAASER